MAVSTRLSARTSRNSSMGTPQKKRFHLVNCKLVAFWVRSTVYTHSARIAIPNCNLFAFLPWKIFRAEKQPPFYRELREFQAMLRVMNGITSVSAESWAAASWVSLWQSTIRCSTTRARLWASAGLEAYTEGACGRPASTTA